MTPLFYCRFAIHEYACLLPERSAISEKLAKNTGPRTTRWQVDLRKTCQSSEKSQQFEEKTKYEKHTVVVGRFNNRFVYFYCIYIELCLN